MTDLKAALTWADEESSICYSSGTGHHEAMILAAAIRERDEELEAMRLGVKARKDRIEELLKQVSERDERIKKLEVVHPRLCDNRIICLQQELNAKTAFLEAAEKKIAELEADLRRLQDAVVNPQRKPPLAGYCVCGHASAYHYVGEPHACNFGYPCRCEAFKEDIF